ncbi:hypothetical protein OMP40_37935 [Cohnella rhizosphaerae]|uniref:Uncharacterized protein n=1 Tax=Cohnella rhizosphaerae TaxID=1457232 RepID=A0A9X4QX77_9BACL|nr:hypothetical protein [Cohnella rhizosphaerae]MDG0814424.1 hypothetical protein [Cohnella rhizosphaerae]
MPPEDRDERAAENLDPVRRKILGLRPEMPQPGANRAHDPDHGQHERQPAPQHRIEPDQAAYGQPARRLQPSDDRDLSDRAQHAERQHFFKLVAALERADQSVGQNRERQAQHGNAGVSQRFARFAAQQQRQRQLADDQAARAESDAEHQVGAEQLPLAFLMLLAQVDHRAGQAYREQPDEQHRPAGSRRELSSRIRPQPSCHHDARHDVERHNRDIKHKTGYE